MRNFNHSQWDAQADRLRAQLPTAPDALMDGYVQWIPWLAMIFGGFGVLLTLGGLLLGAILSPFLLLAGMSGVDAGASAFFALILLLVTSILDVAGGYLMLRRSLTGWWLLALGIVVSILNSVFSMRVFGLVIILLIAYVHLQVKPRYQ
jgi:hypothetical protein